MLPDFSLLEWALAVLAAAGVGLTKSGLTGFGLIPVVMFAALFGARESTGVTLPVLIVGDLLAAVIYRRHADWASIGRMLPPACVGAAIAAWAMGSLGDAQFRPVLGSITLLLAGLQLGRARWPRWFEHVPPSAGFAMVLGLLAGSTTMLTNAAGPVLVVYALAVGLPKLALVGTLSWFFLLINLFKVPFSTALGLLNGSSVLFALVLAPAVAVGMFAGRWVVVRIPQETFNIVLLVGAILASLRLIGVF
jgi:uncharacterized protein